ncbi:hypothetical protein NX80_022940 (plasmid) [Xanthomonas vasicola pv. arecae]|nr:hypothetical protein NX80_022940 [Xanthomonas vasicola pv. arecae]
MVRHQGREGRRWCHRPCHAPAAPGLRFGREAVGRWRPGLAALAAKLIYSLQLLSEWAIRGSADIRVKVAHKVGFHPLHQ